MADHRGARNTGPGDQKRERAGELTRLLRQWADGDGGVEERLAEAIYPLLHRLAARQLQCEGNQALATTELAHEAYLDLFRGRAGIDWRDRQHFFALAARVIRRIVVDFARARRSQKRGGFAVRRDLDGSEPAAVQRTEDMLALDQALDALAEFEPEAARVTELRFYGGMNAEEIAEVCNISTATVGRRWRFARAWLGQKLAESTARTAV